MKPLLTAALVAALLVPAGAQAKKPLTPEQIAWNASQEGVPVHTATSTATAIRCETKGCQ